MKKEKDKANWIKIYEGTSTKSIRAVVDEVSGATDEDNKMILEELGQGRVRLRARTLH